MRHLRRGWLSWMAIAVLAVGCTRSIRFPASEVQNLRPLAGARATDEPLGASLVSGAGEAIGLLDPHAKVALRGDDVVLVGARTELVLHTVRPERELEFQPGSLIFRPAELWLNSTGTLRVPYQGIAGLTQEKFSFGRTLLWTCVIGGTLFLTLVIIGLALGGGDGGSHHDLD